MNFNPALLWGNNFKSIFNFYLHLIKIGGSVVN